MLFDVYHEQTEWKSLSLTHVIYPKDDLYGKFLALFSLLPFGIIVAFFTLTVFVRDIHVISFFAGQLANEILNQFLKRSYREGRPQQIAGKENSINTYGWPSSHSQFIAFFVVYSSLCIALRLRRTHSKLFILFLTFLNVGSLFLIVHSRIYLRYHFFHQCLHGLFIGLAFALAWFVSIFYFVEPFIWEPLLKSSLNQKFLLNFCSIYLPKNTSKATRIYDKNRSNKFSKSK